MPLGPDVSERALAELAARCLAESEEVDESGSFFLRVPVSGLEAKMTHHFVDALKNTPKSTRMTFAQRVPLARIWES